MDSVYSDQLISLGLDPETFPIAHKMNAGSWGSVGKFEDIFAQAPIGLWNNYKGLSNVDKVPNSVIDSVTSSTLSTENIVSVERVWSMVFALADYKLSSFPEDDEIDVYE